MCCRLINDERRIRIMNNLRMTGTLRYHGCLVALTFIVSLASACDTLDEVVLSQHAETYIWITSPHFPEPYPNNVESCWSVSSGGGNHPGVWLEEYDLVNDNDYLHIYDGDSADNTTVIESLTGYGQYKDFLATGDHIFVKFISDSSSSAEGFEGCICFSGGDCKELCHEYHEGGYGWFSKYWYHLVGALVFASLTAARFLWYFNHRSQRRHAPPLQMAALGRIAAVPGSDVGQQGVAPGQPMTQYPPGTYPGQSPPGKDSGQYPTGTYPGQLQPGTDPGQYPKGTYPGQLTPGTDPDQYPTGTDPGTYPGQLPLGTDPGQYPTGTYPGQYPTGTDPGRYPTGTNPGQYPTATDQEHFTAGTDPGQYPPQQNVGSSQSPPDYATAQMAPPPTGPPPSYQFPPPDAK